MKKVITNNKYDELDRMSGFIAKQAECSPCYVRQVLNGDRTPKTNSAKKAQRVLEIADRLLHTFPKAE